MKRMLGTDLYWSELVALFLSQEVDDGVKLR
jgi:hypothetical protein